MLALLENYQVVMKTPEELLIPRIKMIAPMPLVFSCGIEPGQIWHEENGEYRLTYAHRISANAISKYPHLFKKLEWWEDRDPGDLPEYVKLKERQSYTIEGGEREPEVHKIKKHWACNEDWRHNSKNVFVSEWHSKGYSYGAFIPSTKTDYDQQNYPK